MSKIHTERMEVYGELLTPLGTFQLLRLEPSRKEVPFPLKEMGFVEWFVVDTDGVGKHIWVGNPSLVIIKPYHPELHTREVNFQLEE